MCDITSLVSELGDGSWPEPRKTGEPTPVRVYTVLIPSYSRFGTIMQRVSLPLLSIQGTQQ